ncbi:MAG: GNAT family N-acetyltransferase [Candidatus Bipolaricaulota bacterium]|nr:GNAT family N-acetyltransferase [Candidatus Bipolaricaulota bacterium]
MKLRLLDFPRDLTPLGEMICDTFQYPENPQWSVQTDEKEDISHMLASFRRLWPLIRIAQFLSPSMRDMFRGYAAIEDDRIVGVSILQRHGTTNAWVVGTVGVLPEYRRRGIARAAIEKSIELMRQHGAKKTWLGVINGNTPAQRLYESLGFEVYDAFSDYSLADPPLPAAPVLPKEYTISRLPRSNWKTKLALEERIVPEEEREYEPVEKGRFRQPMVLRLFRPIMNLVQRTKEKEFVVRRTIDRTTVARCKYSASTRGKGVNGISVRLDPEQPNLAVPLVALMLHKVVSRSPKLRVEIQIPRWMPAVAEAAESLGFEKRVEYLKMGRSLSTQPQDVAAAHGYYSEEVEQSLSTLLKNPPTQRCAGCARASASRRGLDRLLTLDSHE